MEKKKEVKYRADMDVIKMEMWLRMRGKNLGWKTKAGKFIPLVELSDQHLSNIYAMLLREEEEEVIMEDLRGLSLEDIL